MSVYISKKAIEHNPLPTKGLDIQERVYPRLSSGILANVDYLERLARNDLNVCPLQEGNNDSTYPAVLALKVGLETIAYNESDYNIPGVYFSPKDGAYSSQMTSAVQAFQDFSGILETGIVDALTLTKIDAFLSKYEKAIIDSYNHEFVGESQQKSIEIIQTVDDDGYFIYELIINGERLVYATSKPLHVIPISHTDGDPENFSCLISEDDKDKIAEQHNFPENQNIEFVKTGYQGTAFMIDPDLPLNEASIEAEMNITPPQILGNDDAFLHKVKPGDNLIDIITATYYNGTEDIINPHDDSLIFQLPSRQISPVANRSEDARLQFYLNLIYYYNITEDGTGITEYGIKATQGYNRYDDDLLNDYNMHDNAFDPGTPETVLPNYYRFLKHMEQQSGNPTQIEFDGARQPTSFELEPGKNIWIPSRKFAEGFYYQLNFRHTEMLNEMLDGYDYVSPGELSDTVTQMQGTSFWGTLSTWLRSQVETLYYEVLEFHRKMYEFAIQTLTDKIPRGVGFYFDKALGVTWGYPSMDIATAKSFWRKMTAVNELTFVLREDSEVYLGFEMAVGFSAGFKIGSGKKKEKSGINVGAGFEAKLGPQVIMEYEFPVRPEENGLISFLLTFTTSGRAMSEVMGALNVTNINPRNYLTWMQITLSVRSRVWGAAQVNIDDDGEPIESDSITATITNDPIEEAKDNSFLNNDNILNKLKNIGIQGTGEVSLGIETSYRAKYDDDPLIPEKGGRVPSRVEHRALFFAQSRINVGAIGGMLESLLVNIVGGVTGIFGAISFDRGIALGVGNTYTRTVPARDITYNDTVIDNTTLATQPDNPYLEYNGGNWKTHIYFSSFTGEPDKICAPGTEAMLKLNAGKMYNILQNLAGGTYSFTNLDEIVDIFYSFSYKYKMGLGFNSHNRRSLNGEIFGELTGGQMATGVTRDFLIQARKNTWGLDLYAGVDVGMELLIEDIAEALKYHMRRVYIGLRIFADGGLEPVQEFRIDIARKRTEIERSLNPAGNSILDADCYQLLYSELNSYLINHNEYGAYLQTPDFTDVFKLFSQLYKLFNNYLFKTKSPDQDDGEVPLAMDVSAITADDNLQNVDMGTTDILNVLALTANVLNASAALEAKVGLSAAAHIRLALNLAARLSVSAAGGIIGQMRFMEGGRFMEILPSDPYRVPLEAIKKLLDTSVDNGSKREEGLRRSLTSLPKE